MILNCLRSEITTGTSHFPIFVGFTTAAELSAIAEAPSFSTTTTNEEICKNIQASPVKDWQRPINEDRVTKIAQVFNQAGEFMPNPVLLCENTTLGYKPITIKQQISTGIPTSIWEVQVEHRPMAQSRPLWILDGQHRIKGLAGSSQANAPLPVVLLLNQGNAAYSGSSLAKIFAQVTTEATPLTKIHQEWLTFAFKLKSYAPGTLSAQTRNAMHTVAELCKTPEFDSLNNPFWNQIKFNDSIPGTPGPGGGGFKYDCIELKDLFLTRYYNASPNIGHHVPPADLANEFVRAFRALTASVSAPHDNTVFFGGAKYEQRIMQDAFISGVLVAILERGTGQDWIKLLRDLKFSLTSWNFSNWTISLNGSDGSLSKTLAMKVFSNAFKEGLPWTKSGTLADYLQGNEAKVVFAFSTLSPAGKPIKQGRSNLPVVGGSTLTQQISPARHVRVSELSGNIAKLDLIDVDSPRSKQRFFNAKGFVLTAPTDKNPVGIEITMHHYGGTKKTANVAINW